MIPQNRIGQFNLKHDLDERGQMLALTEEVGELAEAYHREAPADEIAEELADVLFVARSLAELRDINASRELCETIDENLEKDTSTDGSKVTKQSSSTLGDDWSIREWDSYGSNRGFEVFVDTSIPEDVSPNTISKYADFEVGNITVDVNRTGDATMHLYGEGTKPVPSSADMKWSVGDDDPIAVATEMVKKYVANEGER
jgi:NTP pyrophosphatase (non-canonical NTP hydrolase)